MEKIKIKKYFSEVETTKECERYFCSVGEEIAIVILGTICDFEKFKSDT